MSGSPTQRMRMALAGQIIDYAEARERERAELLWRALVKLDSKPERAELRAAGVAASSIEALYPYEFADLVPGLLQRIQKVEPHSMNMKDSWQYHRNERLRINDLLGESLSQKHDELEAFAKTKAWDELYRHLGGRGSENPSQHARVSSVIICLFSAHWYMAHQSGPGAPEAIYPFFTKVIDWVIPNLTGSAFSSGSPRAR